MENEIVKRLIWSGLVAGLSALASVIAARIAGVIWVRVFDEEPPQ